MPARDCAPRGHAISNHSPRRFLVNMEAGVVVALFHFTGSIPGFHIFKMRNGKVVLVNTVIGALSKPIG